jgi:two-component system, sensor histidine kinase and response regulator
MNSARPAVLIVDDIEANLIALEAQLGHLACEIVRASSGNQALALLLKRDFAVMLLDVQMPELNGFEVARYARDNETTRDVPIVFVTAMHETEDNMLRGYGAGAIDVLFKPVNAEVLRSKVQVFLDLHQGKRRLAAEIDAHKETMRELEAFNYSVSHDLRAPLRTIDGFSALLLEEHAAALDDEGREFMGYIRAAAQRMASLIEDLLELSRSGRAELSLSTVDLAATARAIMHELAREAPEREVTFVSVAQARAEGDPGLLRIVLDNLLRNAWKFTSKRSDARIELGVASELGQPVYFVRDNGAGFDPRYREQLFQAFRRLHAARDFAGNGIGLAIVQRIIRRHGGRVWAESRLGQGATFYFTLRDRGGRSGNGS